MGEVFHGTPHIGKDAEYVLQYLYSLFLIPHIKEVPAYVLDQLPDFIQRAFPGVHDGLSLTIPRLFKPSEQPFQNAFNLFCHGGDLLRERGFVKVRRNCHIHVDIAQLPEVDIFKPRKKPVSLPGFVLIDLIQRGKISF